MRIVPRPALLAALSLAAAGVSHAQDYDAPDDDAPRAYAPRAYAPRANWTELGTALAARIDRLRAAYRLPAVPLSPSLTQVALAHVRDLADNHPDQRGCGLHSWSDRGRWTPVCWAAAPNAGPAMWRKPAEITRGRFKGYGFEIAVGAEDVPAVTPEQAVATWMGSPLHRDVLLQQGAWRGRTWRAMGVAVYGGYAVAWFSDSAA